jgi:hypothetical protein
VQDAGRGDTRTAWAVDATYARKHFKLFGEVLQNYGVLNPRRYVSGGPSRRVTDLIAGTEYVAGPATFRFTYSAGFDEQPSGWQQLFVPGVTLALTKERRFLRRLRSLGRLPGTGSQARRPRERRAARRQLAILNGAHRFPREEALVVVESDGQMANQTLDGAPGR